MTRKNKHTEKLYEEIYKLRGECGRTRQGNWSTDLDLLDRELRTKLKRTHPYTITREDRLSLENKVKAFQNGGNGEKGKITSAGYLYRIANPIDVYSNINRLTVQPEQVAKFARLQWNKINRLSDNGKNGRNWLRLSDFGKISYSAYSSISWWTTDRLSSGRANILSATTKLGLFENWIANQSYILRCPIKMSVSSNIVNVPSAIDAFASSVFYTTENSKTPKTGLAIDLSLSPIAWGANEYVLKKIELRHIEIKPILIPDHHRKKFNTITSDSPEILARLIDYYTNLP
jgi:hypothetical protein